jgi:hypothetical protein
MYSFRHFSLMGVLCHGEPTLANILFKYGTDGQPTDAMVMQAFHKEG